MLHTAASEIDAPESSPVLPILKVVGLTRSRVTRVGVDPAPWSNVPCPSSRREDALEAEGLESQGLRGAEKRCAQLHNPKP